MDPVSASLLGLMVGLVPFLYLAWTTPLQRKDPYEQRQSTKERRGALRGLRGEDRRGKLVAGRWGDSLQALRRPEEDPPGPQERGTLPSATVGGDMRLFGRAGDLARTVEKYGPDVRIVDLPGWVAKRHGYLYLCGDCGSIIVDEKKQNAWVDDTGVYCERCGKERFVSLVSGRQIGRG